MRSDAKNVRTEHQHHSFVLNLFSLQFPQTGNSTADCDSTSSGKGVCTASNNLAATLAAPDTCASSLYRVLTTESTAVCRVLTDLNLTKELTQGGTVPGTVLSCDSDLLRALSHLILKFGGCA
mmetsp:Transcript_1459/g.2089  ORF Transcript_1459/g.2089 Transcript_1459/m.2089 type:complete len:123 (-) Transcript_1459:155-523(-)